MMISKYVVEKWEREAEWSMCYGKRQKGRNEDREEQADAGDLLATTTWGDGEKQTQAVVLP